MLKNKNFVVHNVTPSGLGSTKKFSFDIIIRSLAKTPHANRKDPTKVKKNCSISGGGGGGVTCCCCLQTELVIN